MNVHSFYDEKTNRTKFWVFCGKCGKHYYICTTPKAALKSATSHGFDVETGTCKVCHVIASMQPLIEKRSAA
jgi:hypothetical protein